MEPEEVYGRYEYLFNPEVGLDVEVLRSNTLNRDWLCKAYLVIDHVKKLVIKDRHGNRTYGEV